MLRRGLAPGALVLGVTVASWLVSGVALFDIVRFLGYEGAFVLLPGASLLWALRRRKPGPLLAIAVGWPLGHTMEILTFSATAALGSRGLYFAYPVIVVVCSSFMIWRVPRSTQQNHAAQQMSRRVMWTAAAALSLGLIYLAFMFLPQTPLPSVNGPVSYYLDFPFFIGLTAEALNHWPAMSPGLSGVPLHYEWFVFLHMAAVSQVTHLAIPIIALRLDYAPTMIVIGCQLLAVGRLLGREAWTGVIAIAVVFLLGPLDLTTDYGSSPFVDRLSFHLWASWTFPFGLMFFLALLYLINERLQSPTWRTHDDLRSWMLIALLMVGASGAKATILPVIISGVALYAVVVGLTKKRVSATALVTSGLGIAVFTVTFFVVYGGGVPGTVIQPLVWLGGTYPVTVASGITLPALRSVAVPIAYVAGLAGALLPLAGMIYMLRRRHRGEISTFTLCLCMLGAGLLISTVVHQVSYSEEYFLDTGFVAGCVVAAAGLRMAWSDLGRALPASIGAAIAAFGAWIVLLLVLVALSSRSITPTNVLGIRYAGLVAGSAAFVLAWTVVLRGRHLPRSGALSLALIPMLAATALTSPILLSPTLRKLVTGGPIFTAQPDPQAVRALTPGLLTALLWIRDHSSVDAVFAVSNHWTDPEETNGSYFYYSAFAERRVFVEAYNPIRFGITSGEVTAASVNFAYRRRLNDAVFGDANAAALQILTRQYSVRWLFIDRIHHNAGLAVLQLGRVVFSNHDATVIAVG